MLPQSADVSRELQSLSDDELRTRIIVLKRLEREGKQSGYCCPVLMRAWYECCRRDRPDLYEAALQEVRREEAEHRAANARARQALKDALAGKE